VGRWPQPARWLLGPRGAARGERPSGGWARSQRSLDRDVRASLVFDRVAGTIAGVGAPGAKPAQASRTCGNRRARRPRIAFRSLRTCWPGGPGRALGTWRTLVSTLVLLRFRLMLLVESSVLAIDLTSLVFGAS
jgi:hypothetical protein